MGRRCCRCSRRRASSCGRRRRTRHRRGRRRPLLHLCHKLPLCLFETLYAPLKLVLMLLELLLELSAIGRRIRLAGGMSKRVGDLGHLRLQLLNAAQLTE